MQNFRKFAVLLLEILGHEVRLVTRERLIAFQCLHLEFIFNDAKSLFYHQNGFPDLKLYFRDISAIVNKRKSFMSLIFHDLSFGK